LDGKTVRGAKSASAPQSITPHIVSAMATDQGLCLGQFKVIDKSNEISAITELLDVLYRFSFVMPYIYIYCIFRHGEKKRIWILRNLF